MTKILLVSALCSTKSIDSLFSQFKRDPGFAVQKFLRMIVNGLNKNNDSVSTLSAYPVNFADKILFVKNKKEYENSVEYNYVPFLNIPIIKHLMMFCYTFVYLMVWSFFDKKNKVVVCDALNISLCIASLLACKLRNIKIVGILTDMPDLISDSSTMSMKKKIISRINKFYLGQFSHYVFLTESMNQIVNKKNKPYIVMEGLVDENYIQSLPNKKVCNVKTILYAGGLSERYGLKLLVDAFRSLNDENIQLLLYGAGPYVAELKTTCMQDPRIKYMGVVSNESILQAEIDASLLVNPRPTTEEFTKYSFPSKNMEYMLSGTPLLTTKLPGMPKEYYPYVYLFEEESVESYAKKLKELLSKNLNELVEKGSNARNFVLMYKNNIVQCRRILEMIS